MVFVGAAILPHGAMIFDGDPNTTIPACLERNKTMPSDIISNCHKLFTACERVSDLLAQTNYDVVLLLTPHGISLSSGSFGVYMSGVARGNALWNGCFEEFELSVELDNELSEHLLEFVQKRGIGADGIITFSRMETPLRWGEVIPLWFVKNKPGVKSSKVKYVIVSVGAKSKNFEAMGRALHSFVSSLQQRIAVVVSGDLAHTHKTDCNVPLYMPDPRWSDLKPTDIADEFDKTWELWAKSIPHCDSDKSAVRSGDLGDIHPWSANQSLPWLTKVTQDDCIARSCGLRGFRILHSFLEKEIEDGGTIMPRFLARCAPTYYGMMVVFFSVSKQS